MQDPRKDFFISYNSKDRAWAEWIAWQLEEAGFSVVIQAWDFRPGSNFVLEMDKAAIEAERTITVISPDYLKARYTQPEWAAAFRRDPIGEQGLLLPVHVRECRHELKGLLGSLIYIDLVGLDEAIAREKLLAGIRRERAKPPTTPSFPGSPELSFPERPGFPGAFPSIWNAPYQRNMLFTGREDILEKLHTLLTTGQTAALTQPQAISGLGGIGKTQIAIEYTYRYHTDYMAVFWVKADLREVLISDFVSIADLLNLPEKNEQDQSRVVNAVKRWLQSNTGWLLIFDNADDLAMVKDFIPSAGTGHMLLTTRAQAMSRLAQRIELEKMEIEEGALFLLRRANIIVPEVSLDAAAEADRAKAKEITKAMDGHPLALDQAGAYIEETACSLSDYLKLYQTRRAELLARRGGVAPDHPESVTTTFSLSFRKVAQANPASIELLKLFAFLHPDAIPEEIITEGAPDLGAILRPVAADPNKLNIAIAELLKYSLVHRNAETKTMSIHRLVQAVLKDEMKEDAQRRWVERTVKAVNRVFQDSEFTRWQRYHLYIPQAQVCATLMEQWDLVFSEAAELLKQAGSYLQEILEYPGAETFLKQHLKMIYEQNRNPDPPRVAVSLGKLAGVYYEQGKYAQAEPLLKHALAIREKVLGPEHPHTATGLSNLAALYRAQGKLDDTELLNKQSLTTREQTLKTEHFDVINSLNKQASLYRDQGKYDEAELLYQQALEISERTLGSEHLELAKILSDLGGLYYEQDKYYQAEPLYRRALTICERTLEPDDLFIAFCLNNLAALYHAQGKYYQAEPLYRRALAIREQILGSDHPDVVLVSENYTDLLQEMKSKTQSVNSRSRTGTARFKRNKKKRKR